MTPDQIQQAYEAGPWGVAALLTLALIFCVRHIISLYGEKDTIRLQQINDTKIALEAVTKSTDNLNNAEDRMTEQTALLKEWVIVTRAQQTK